MNFLCCSSFKKNLVSIGLNVVKSINLLNLGSLISFKESSYFLKYLSIGSSILLNFLSSILSIIPLV